MTRTPDRIAVPAVLVAVFIGMMPFLAGLPRGAAVPSLRPSEVLQLLVTGVAVAVAGLALFRGDRWRLVPSATDRSLMVVAAAGSILPLIWLVARARVVGTAELLAALPFVKYTALYVLVRLAVRTDVEVRLVRQVAVGAALVVAAITVAQSLGIDPVVELLTRYFVNSDSELVADGRGTSTIGSSIATGSYLTIAFAIALSAGFAGGRLRWYVGATILAVGALASGQAGTVIALGAVLVALGLLYGRTRQLLTWGAPIGAVAVLGLWPIVAARVADLDQGSGLPQSWIIRWTNITELYWPALADGGWVLGVTPDATVAPPDVWRDVVYLESGYLWLLWVGGLPLLVAVVAFLRAAYLDLGQLGYRPSDQGSHRNEEEQTSPESPAFTDLAGDVANAARAAVAMLVLLSVFDPHLTLRAGADLFFVLLALGLQPVRPVEPVPVGNWRWRELLGPPIVSPPAQAARLQIAETAATGCDVGPPGTIESAIAITAAAPGRIVAGATMVLVRRGPSLHAVLTEGPDGDDPDATALIWRGVALCSNSLRLDSLTIGTDGAVIGRGALKWAAQRAELLEIERARGGPSMGAEQPLGRPPAPMGAGPADRPAIRLCVGHRSPRWKRATDIALGAVALVVTAPLWAVCALLVQRSSPGPVLFRQVRIGIGGLPFQIYKFRTMYVDNDDTAFRAQNRRELLAGAAAGKDSNDKRITSIGRWLRRSSLDELPQLVNVGRGEMSLVGPRPSLPWEVELYEPSRRRRLTVPPGVTGLWQVSGRSQLSLSEMLEIDLDYVDAMSPVTDLRCLVGTARSVVSGDGAR